LGQAPIIIQIFVLGNHGYGKFRGLNRAFKKSPGERSNPGAKQRRRNEKLRSVKGNNSGGKR
jgi:hypothetical protein